MTTEEVSASPSDGIDEAAPLIGVATTNALSPAPPSPANTFATTNVTTVLGNQHETRGVDETLSQALSRARADQSSASFPPPASGDLKSPPEDIPFDAECEVVLDADDFDT